MTDEWLECVPWSGEEKDLPVGEETRIPGFRAIDLVRRWEVLDVEEESGFRTVKKSELKPTDIIIGAVINENAFDKLIETYGRRFFVAKHTEHKTKMDRWEWKATIGGDVLELEALKQMRMGDKKIFNI